MAVRFIVDHNVGKLVRWLRMMGYDSLLFTGSDDGMMVKTALREDRVIITRDSGIARRRLAVQGQIKVIMVEGEDSSEQMRQVADALKLDFPHRPFTICIECNSMLEPRTGEEVKGCVPLHVYKTHSSYMQCPSCRRIYWRGTHWQAMCDTLDRFEKEFARK